jgi:hypothetical protein
LADEPTPRRWRPGPQAIAAIGIAVGTFGVFATWTNAGPVSLNGTQGPNDGWLVIIALAFALGFLRSLGHGWWLAVAGVAEASLVVGWVAIEDWLQNRDALDADPGYGLFLVLAASLALAAAAVMRGLQLVDARRATPPESSPAEP